MAKYTRGVCPDCHSGEPRRSCDKNAVIADRETAPLRRRNPGEQPDAGPEEHAVQVRLASGDGLGSREVARGRIGALGKYDVEAGLLVHWEEEEGRQAG